MTETDFSANFPGRIVDEADYDRAEKIEYPNRRPIGEWSGYTGEVLKTADLAKAKELAQQKDLMFKGGIRHWESGQPVVRAYFWRVRQD